MKRIEPGPPLTSGQVAKLLRVSTDTVAHLAETGVLKGAKVPVPMGARPYSWQFERADVAAYINSSAVKP